MIQNVEENGRFEIFVMASDGANKTRLTVNANSDDDAPRWSPGGSKIAFISVRSGQRLLYTMNADGTAVTQIYDMPAFAPTWSPDGTKPMFVARPDSTINLEVYTVNIDGAALTQITETPDLLEDSPYWAP